MVAAALDSTRGGRFTPARPRRSPAPRSTPAKPPTPPPPAPATAPPAGDDDDQGATPDSDRTPPARAGVPRLSVPSTVDTGAGFVLGLLVWGWIVLPFVNPPKDVGSIANVRNVLRAKFFNKAPDGSWLP